MTSIPVAELKDERRRAFEELSVALEAISSKSLMDFRGRLEVPRPVQSVAAASVCMVARVDETVEVGPDGLPPRTWEAAQVNMAKPGSFVNSLRQFPYAVDSGRMPDVNVYAARQCLEDVSPEHLANEPVALRLYEWILAAWRYTEVVQMLRLQTSVGAGMPATTAASLQDNGYAGAQVQRSTPPSSPENAQYGEAAPLEISGDTPGRPMRSSMGSSVGGSNSVFGRSPVPDPSPGGESTRSSRPSGGIGGGQAAAGGRVAQPVKRPNAAASGYVGRRSQGQDSTQSSTLRVTPSGSPSQAASSPASRGSPGTPQRASPSQPSTRPRRQQQAAPVGYPRGPRSNVGIEDWQQKLEQMRREAREMKAMEGQLKWSIKREEDKERKEETREDTRQLMNWRQERNKGLTEYAADRALADKVNTLREAREFQDFKRLVKSENKQEETQQNNDTYQLTKEQSEYAVEMKRSGVVEERQMVVDQNLERYALMAMYNEEESSRVKMDQKLAREMAEEEDLSLQMVEARKERDAALQSLEFFRQQQRAMPVPNQHIPSRPYLPDNKPV